MQALARQNISLQPGDAVIIDTDWGKYRGKNNGLYGFNAPGIGTGAGVWLSGQQAILIGAEKCCIEFRSPESRRLDVRSMKIIVHGIYLIENMKLEADAPADVYEYLIVVQPLKVKGATG